MRLLRDFVQEPPFRPLITAGANHQPTQSGHFLDEPIAGARMAVRVVRKVAERRVISLHPDQPRKYRGPPGQPMERGKALGHEQPREGEAIPEAERARDGVGRADGTFDQEDGLDDRTRAQAHPWTGGTDRGQRRGEHGYEDDP